MKIEWWLSIIQPALLIVLSIVALADFLQGGIVWPCLFIVIVLQVAAAPGVLR
jgi:hypothetical protein